MKKLFILPFLAGVGLPQSVYAAASSMQVANQLGTILGSEEYCELKLKPEGVEAFIEKQVKPDDTQFASTLNMMTEGTKFQLQGKSDAAKIAHCTQVKRSAKANGLID